MTEQLPKQEAEPDDGATLGETARQLQMPAATVRRWARNGWLPSTVTAAGEARFDRSLTAIAPESIDGEPSDDGRS
jgi:hypothetical protein